MQEKYPCLDPSNERKHMSDREILEKYLDIDGSCLTEIEMKILWICYTSIKKHSV